MLRFARGPIVIAWVGITLSLASPWLEDRIPVVGPYLGRAYALGITAAAVWFLHWKRALLKDLSRSNYRLCRNCLHDLSASPETGLCPECAHPYTHTALRTAWLPSEPPPEPPTPDPTHPTP